MISLLADFYWVCYLTHDITGAYEKLQSLCIYYYTGILFLSLRVDFNSVLPGADSCLFLSSVELLRIFRVWTPPIARFSSIVYPATLCRAFLSGACGRFYIARVPTFGDAFLSHCQSALSHWKGGGRFLCHFFSFCVTHYSAIV